MFPVSFLRLPTRTGVNTALAQPGAGLGAGLLLACLTLATPAQAVAAEAGQPGKAGPAPAATALPAGVKAVRSLEGVSEYRLDNGLQVLLYPDRSRPTVTVNVTYKVGSRMENYGETGMAHLLEHLMFKGSRHYPHPVQDYSARGFRFNGTTSFDRTNYFCTFAAGGDNLAWSLAQMADAMTGSFIARKDLDSEMTVVRNEYEMGENQPGSVLEKRLLSLMFDWHNYGKETIGARSDIENVSIEHLQAFYRTYYQPDNAVLILSGNFDAADALRRIARHFGSIARPARKLPVLWTVEPVQDGERAVWVRRKGDTQIVMLGYHAPAERSREQAALGVAMEVLGGTPNGRLHHELVEKGLATAVFASYQTNHDSGIVTVGAKVKPGDPIEPVRDRLIELVEGSLAAQAPSGQEIGRVLQDNATAFDRILTDPQEFGVALSESIAQGDWRLFFLDREQTAQVDSTQAQAVAARYLRRDNRSVAIFQPEDAPRRAEIPAPLPAEDLLRDLHPRAAAAAVEAFDPSQDSIDAHTRRLQIGDLKVALLPHRTRGATVNVAMSFHFGDLASLRGKSVVRELTGAMIGRGTAKLTRQQIADEMTRLHMTGHLFEFQTQGNQLAEALGLAASAAREASFPLSEFEQLQRESLAGLRARLSEPSELSRDTLMGRFDHYPADDPRHYQSLAEHIAALEGVRREDLVAFHRDFWGTARGEIAIVGDFDPELAERSIRALFPGWVSPAPYAHVVREFQPVAGARQFINTPDKENGVYRSRIAFALRDTDPDAAALMLANEVLGGGSGLHSRLVDRIRQKDGLSYGVGSGLSVGARDNSASWGVGAIAAPQNLGHVEADVREELDRALREGLTAREIEEARTGLLQERLMNRSEDGPLAAAWVANMDLDRSFAFSRDLEARLRALDASAVNAVMRRYLDPAALVTVVAGDGAKGAH